MQSKEKELLRVEEASNARPRVAPLFENRIDALQGGGHPFPASTRSFMEPRFGVDFGSVRVHTDSSATELVSSVNAQAFTVGRDIVFGPGQYTPETEPGRRLLAHELAHVVQQGGGSTVWKAMVVQRTTKCSLDHIDAECAGAAGKCLPIQDSYCKKKYPKPVDIETLHNNAIKGANDQRKKYPFAAKNLLHFLSGSGTEKVMPVDIFKNHAETKEKFANEHRNKFIIGAEKRLKSGVLKPGKFADMVWTGTANAFSFSPDDLGIAVGGYTLCSKVKVSVADKGSRRYDLYFDSWTVQAFDCYNWDPGKGIGLQGADDNDLCCLQNAGKGKHFKIRTDVWNNTHVPSMEKETISG